MGLFNFLFKNKRTMVDDFLSRDAIVLDVRTEIEYAGGAITGSKNIPLQILNSKISSIKKLNKPIITCCASGMRSGSAAMILRNNGIEVMNGGGWRGLNQLIAK